MYILTLETTGKYGSASVISENGLLVIEKSENEMNHLQDIISISDKALNTAKINKSDLTHIACSVGPGSFTGIRIGVTTARTLAQMLGLPCIAVSSLYALAEQSISAAEKTNCTLILACINARRHQTYAELWQLEDGKLTEISNEKQYMIEEILEIANQHSGKIFVTGDGIDAYQDIIEDKLESYVLADEGIRYQSADGASILACEYAESGNTISYEQLLPNYMRLAEAEQKLQAGTLSSKISNTVQR